MNEFDPKAPTGNGQPTWLPEVLDTLTHSDSEVAQEFCASAGLTNEALPPSTGKSAATSKEEGK